MIKKIKSKLTKNEFVRNSLTLITGTVLAQLAPILVSPILTRLYTPEDFGTLAIFMSIVIILGTIINGRYELAVILPDKKEDAINIFALGIILAFVISLILFIIILISHDYLIDLLNNKNLTYWLYLIPLVVFLFGLFNMLNYYNTRLKKYKTIAQAKVYKSVGTISIQLGLFFTKNGVVALLTGYSLSNVFGNIQLLKNVLADKELLKEIKLSRIKKQAKRYIRFPKLTLPGSLANKLSSDLTNILISSIFSASILGFYSLANRILGVPSAFIGVSISQVFLQQATDEKKKTGRAIIIFKSVLKKLIIIGVPFFTILYFSAEWAFSFAFGEEWRMAGVYARIAIPLIFIRFLVAPLSVSLSIFEKQHISLLLQLGLLALSLTIIGVSYYFNFSFIGFLQIFVATLFFYYLYFLFILYKVVKS